MDLPFWVAIPVVALFIPITAIVADAWKAVKEREQDHRERLKAIEMGLVDSIPPAISKAEGSKPAQRNGTSKHPALHGAVWAGVGFGLLVSTLLVHQMSDNEGMIAFANFLMLWSFPALGVGVGLIIYAMARKGQAKPDAGGA